MGTTQLCNRGTNVKNLSDQMVRFVMEYLIDYNGTRAAIAAGYAKSGAHTRACTLLKKPKIRALVGKLRKEQNEKFQIQSDEVLWHLWACATRNGKSFVDKKGRLLLTSQNINDLPDEVTAAIDSIKQRRKTYTTEDGEQIEEIETEVRLVSKAAALDMAMKHKGLFATQQVEGKLIIDFDAMYRDQRGIIDVDLLEQKLLEEERK